jgi:amino acid transporter
MAVKLQGQGVPSASSTLGRRLTAGGTIGNERLTAVTGAILIVLLAIIGVTIISLRNLLWVQALLRVIAPMVVLCTVVVVASGVALLFAGPQSRDTLLPIHKVSFIVWVALTAIHVLGHLPAIPAALRADFGRPAELSHDVTGRAGRALSLASALTAGLVLAILVIPQFAPRLHAHNLFHHHH